MREKLQMEVDIKYLADENERLKPIVEDCESVKCEIRIHEQNKR